ncbi:MAG: hypothetical protein K6F48_09705, partial [Paludibacteraceae bacterium]|nr:hypothetical protein [Paludibacteraceae bacterium]
DDNCAIFRKFSYETRISSREFCQHLCIPHNFENFAGNDIVGFITKQTWFYSAWKQDPTIQSMLRMLGGTKHADKNSDDIMDGIEELFQETYVDDFKYYWEKLTQKETIVFYHLPLKDFGLSDDLYIKMNARGKQLTSFENFKADLIGYITKQSEDESLEESEQTKWKELLDPKNGIPIKLDTDWTDIFWKNRSKDSKIDEIYFAFINRYFLQELICAKKEDNTDLYSANDLEEKNGTYKYLYGNKSDDSKLQYSGLDKYLLNDDEAIPLSFFISFRDTLNNYKPNYTCCKFFGGCCLNTCFPAWVDSKIEFIPKYDETGNITTLGQKERVIFLAICRYFEKDSFDETSFKQWMRVVWNIVENSGIETISAMIGAMRLIDELSEGGHNIYNFLSNSQLRIKSNFAKEQVAEEIAKAKQIVNGGDEWESKIIEAEKYAFFKGAIRFLFQNEKGEVDDCWTDFDTKWHKAHVEYKDYDYNTLRAFISKCTTEQELKNIIYDTLQSTWKSNLLNKSLNEATHYFLVKDRDNRDNSDNGNGKWEKAKKDLVGTTLLDNINYNGQHLNGCLLRNDKYGQIALFPYAAQSNRKKFVIANSRNTILSNLQKQGKIESDQIIENCDFFWGWDISFNYISGEKHYVFQWNTDGNVYLIENNERKKRDDSYYYFKTDGIDDQKTIEKLDCLIAQAYPDADKSVCEKCQDKFCKSTSEQ